MKNRIRKLIILVTAVLAAASVPSGALASNLNPDTLLKEDSKTALCLYEDTTDTFIYRHNETKKMYPASTTKIMTAVVTVENVKDLKKKIKIGKEIEWTPAGSSVAWLQAGEVLSYEDLLYALMLPSGNDAAAVLAVNVGKIIDPSQKTVKGQYNAFVKEMNRVSVKAGMENTHFVNSHGFHNPNHYTNAASLARLAAYADNYPEYEKVVKTLKYKVKTNKATHVWKNHNAVVNPKSKFYYKLAKGDKTGFTNDAGKCVVTSSINEEGQRFYSVIMKSPSTKMEFGHTRDLLKYANENTRKLHVKNGGKNLFWYLLKNSNDGTYALMRVSTEDDIDLFCDKKYTEEDLSLEFRPEETHFKKMEDERMLEYTPDDVNDEDNKTVGEVVVVAGDRDLKEVDAYAKGGITFRTTADIIVILVVLAAVLVALIAVFVELIQMLLKKRARRKQLKMMEAEQNAQEEKTDDTAEADEESVPEDISAEEEPAEDQPDETSGTDETKDSEEAAFEKSGDEETVKAEAESEEKGEITVTVDEDTGIMTIGRKTED